MPAKSTKADRTPGRVPFKGRKLLREAINETDPIERSRKMKIWTKYLSFLIDKRENYHVRKVIL